MRKTIVVLCALQAAACPLHAQTGTAGPGGPPRDNGADTTGVLQLVEITASSAQNKELLYQPASISKLGLTELKRGTGLFLDDAVNTSVPGVFMERRSVSGGQQFNIRGYGNGLGPRGASSNFDGQGYKVYLNGIPVTDAEGVTLMDDLDFGSVGNVEVIKGPAGSLYGLAIAGVVNLRTVQPEKGKTVVGQEALLGSYGLQRFTTRAQVGGERAGLLVTYGYQHADGYMAHTASFKNFVNMVGTFQPNERQTVSTYLGYSSSYDQRGGELTIGQYDTGNYSGNPAYIKNDAHSEIISFRAGVSNTYRFNRHFSNTTTLFGSGISNNSSSAAGWTDKLPVNYGLRSTLDLTFRLAEKFGLSGIAGVEAQQQYAQVIGYGMVADSTNLSGPNRIGAARSNQLLKSGTTSVFTEWTLSMPLDIALTAGLGLSNQRLELNDRFYVATSRNPATFVKSYTGLLSPHLAVNKVFSSRLSVYASYSTGYKAPVTSSIYIPTTGAINGGLRPERGRQFEVGTKGSLLKNRLSYQLAVFDARFANKLTAVAVPLNGTTTAYTYTANGGDQHHQGLEVALSYLAYSSADGFFKSVSPFANLAYSDFRYEHYQYQSLDASKKTVTADYDGKAVAGVAPLTASAGVDLVTRIGLYGNATYSFRDAMPISSDGANLTKSFSLLNAKLGFRTTFFSRLALDVYAGAGNLTRTQYYYMVFINQLPDAYLPAPRDVNFFGGIGLNYTF